MSRIRRSKNPHGLKEYQAFVDSVTHLCDCNPESDRPCAGVLAGGVCDGLGAEISKDELDSMIDEVEVEKAFRKVKP